MVKKKIALLRTFMNCFKYQENLDNNDEKILYITMHERKNDEELCTKTCGNSVDDRINVEGQVNILFRSLKKDDTYVFQTQNGGDSVYVKLHLMFQ